MADDWDKFAQEIAEQKLEAKQAMKYRDPALRTIFTELHEWWSGISTGNIKFIKGMPLLEEYLPAYIPGHVIVISGYTSAGKSQLLAQITQWCAGDRKADTLVFSNEDSRMEKLISILAAMTNIHRKKMLLGSMSDEERQTAYNIYDTIESWPLRIHDDILTMPAMESLIKQQNPKIVILDYVQNVVVLGGSIYERMVAAAQWIFRMAQTYGVTFFVASQIANEAVQNESDVISLKGAGELAASAHTVVQLKKGRKDLNRNQVVLQIRKNKAFGPCGDVNCQFNDTWTAIEKAGDRWSV